MVLAFEHALAEATEAQNAFQHGVAAGGAGYIPEYTPTHNELYRYVETTGRILDFDRAMESWFGFDDPFEFHTNLPAFAWWKPPRCQRPS